jgi:hypothetical protein
VREREEQRRQIEQMVERRDAGRQPRRRLTPEELRERKRERDRRRRERVKEKRRQARDRERELGRRDFDAKVNAKERQAIERDRREQERARRVAEAERGLGRAERTEELYARLKAKLGDRLVIEGPMPDAIHLSSVRTALLGLDKLDDALLRGLVDRHVTWYIGDRTVPDLDQNDYLRNVRPRGWPEGSTWSQVGGAYSPFGKKVNSGSSLHSGSANTALHETGHAIGDVFELDDDDDLIEHHKRLHHKLIPYLQQEGPGGRAGRQELIAESVAWLVWFDRDYLVSRTDEAYASWLESMLSYVVKFG